MANTSYLGANVISTDSFAGWIDKTNQVRHDMGTIAVTVTTIANTEPNTSVGGYTSGNAAISGVFTANTIAVSQYLRGGTVTGNAGLIITSNAEVQGDLTYIKSSNTTIGPNNSTTLIVNSISDFNANVNVDGVFTVTANATFSGANVNINGNTTIGDLSTDRLVVNAILSSDLVPLDNTIDLGTTVNNYGNIFATFVYSVNNIQTSNNLILAGVGARTIKTDSTNNNLGSFTFVVANTTTSNTVLIANTTGLFASANIAYDLGSATVSWGNIYGKELTVANTLTVGGNTVIAGDLTVTGTAYLSSNAVLSIDEASSNNSTVASLLTVNGNTIIGNASSDVIQFNASANSNFVPAANLTYNIGSTTRYWANTYSNNVIASNIIANTVSYLLNDQTSLTATIATTTQTAIASFSATTYGSAEVTITAKNGVNRHIVKLLVVHDGTTAYATEYGSMFTSSTLSTYDVDISGGNVRILATPVSSNTSYNVILTRINA